MKDNSVAEVDDPLIAAMNRQSVNASCATLASTSRSNPSSSHAAPFAHFHDEENDSSLLASSQSSLDENKRRRILYGENSRSGFGCRCLKWFLLVFVVVGGVVGLLGYFVFIPKLAVSQMGKTRMEIHAVNMSAPRENSFIIWLNVTLSDMANLY